MIDQYYTPEHIALNLVKSFKGQDIKYIADFSVGDGSLIKKLPFKATKIIGLDIDSNVISSLTNSNPKWDLKNGDFLNPDESTTIWLSKFKNKLDLIILNPPFSCKGKKRIPITDSENVTIMFRPYLAFVYKSLKYLNKTGVLVAILPLSCIKSDVDNIGLTYISKLWEIDYGEKFGPNVFQGCSPSSIVLTIKAKDNLRVKNSKFTLTTNCNFTAQILRGAMQMHNTFNKGIHPVLHTSNLQNFEVTYEFKFCTSNTKLATGYYVCIPRVGLPKKDKIVLVCDQSFILSDCIIAIRGEYLEQTLFIKNLILENWETFKELYQSTCAPYITINQLKSFLLKYKIDSVSVTSFDTKKNSNNSPLSISESLVA